MAPKLKNPAPVGRASAGAGRGFHGVGGSRRRREFRRGGRFQAQHRGGAGEELVFVPDHDGLAAQAALEEARVFLGSQARIEDPEGMARARRARQAVQFLLEAEDGAGL